MDESCVLLVNLHQLLVSFVPHAGLWVCSHCNEVGYTLHRWDKKKRSHKCVYITNYSTTLYTKTLSKTDL